MLYFQDKEIIVQGTMYKSKRERVLEEGEQNQTGLSDFFTSISNIMKNFYEKNYQDN